MTTPTSAEEKHLRTLLAEFERRYEKLTERIAAIETDISRELDSERKLILEERRAELAREREQVVEKQTQIEMELTHPSSARIGLAFLEDRADAQQREGRFSTTERDTLKAIYRSALSRPETLEALVNAHLCVDPVNINEGETMTAQNPNIVNLAESVFTRTSYSLAQDLARVVEYQGEWTELIVGDPVTDKTIQALNNMQERMEVADRVAAQYVAPSLRRRFQIERDGMVSSAKELASIFDGLSNHLSAGTMPWSIHQQMERHLDDLTYYTNRCLLWLSDLAASTRHAETLQ